MKRQRWMKGERGLQTLEWVALGLVILALLGAVVAYLNGPGGSQVAAPMNRALQQYAWCLEGYASCGWGGSAGTPGIGRPGAGSPGSSQPGVNPPGGSPPGVNPPDSKPMKPWEWAWWCVTHPGECAHQVGEWAQDRWEGAKQTARRAVDTLRSGVQAVWDWVNQHKGIVAGIIVAGLILAAIAALVLAGVALSPLVIAFVVGAVVGALLFGYIFDRYIPADQRTWGGAFLFVIQGAVLGGLALLGLYMVLTKGIATFVSLLFTKGISGGIYGVISYMILTPFEKWSWAGIGIAFAAGVFAGIVAGIVSDLRSMVTLIPMAAAIETIGKTINAVIAGRLTVYTPVVELFHSIIKRLVMKIADDKIDKMQAKSINKFLVKIGARSIYDVNRRLLSNRGPNGR